METTVPDTPCTADNQDAALLTNIGFIGQVLSVFFLFDPQQSTAHEAYDALETLDVQEAAAGWPFVDETYAQECLALMKDSLKGGKQSIGDEYRRLFVGPFKKAAPLWGSVYTDKYCSVFGESTLALLDWMQTNGIQRMCEGEADPDDHFGVLLAMLPMLVSQKPELVKEFLQEHVLTWSSHFLDAVLRETIQSFFIGLARLTKASLEGAQDALSIKVTYPAFCR